MAAKKPSRGHLFNLKEWLTVDDAAKHLSIAFGEEVTNADIFRLALDNRLKLSVRFVNGAQARRGQLVPQEEVPIRIWPPILENKGWNGSPLPPEGVKQSEVKDLPEDIIEGINDGRLIAALPEIHYKPGLFLILDKPIKTIWDVWDLPLIGAERLDVEHAYQNETDGPSITATYLDGVFVEREGVPYQLQEDFYDNEYQAGSKAHLRALKERIEAQEIGDAEAKDLLEKYKAARTKFLEHRRERSPDAGFYPAGKLPDDSVFVVKTAALRDFEREVMSPVDSGTEKPVSKREESTYLNIIGALLGLMTGTTPAGKSQSVFGNESAIKAALLARYEGKPGISQRTLDEKFPAAKRSLES